MLVWNFNSLSSLCLPLRAGAESGSGSKRMEGTES